MSLAKKNIAIVGAGLVGSLLSIYLSKRGYSVSIFEGRSDMRKDHIQAGRSINLALSDRGRGALKQVGLEEKILSISVPVYKRLMHSEKNELTEQFYGKKDQAIFSVPRRELNCMLMDLAEDEGVKIYFSKKCNDIDFDKTNLKFDDNESLHFDFVFGADGAGSVIRKKMNKFPGIDVFSEFIDCGYKELTIPIGNHGKWQIASNALHIWPRGSYMVMALPNLDGTFTCTLFFPMKGENSFEILKNEKDVNLFFEKNCSDLVPLIPNISEQYFNNPVSPLGIIRCSTWKKNNFILIGDSCHATVPFYGQGMNCGFEDCKLIADVFDKTFNTNNFTNSIEIFLTKRKINTDAMQDLSMHNFIVMRDKTGDERFLLQKKIEALFAMKHPSKWSPLYSMVTFSHIDYNEALEIGMKQEKIMQKIMQIDNIESIWNGQEVEQKILSFL